MVKEIEQTFKASDGQELFYKIWQPDEPASAHLVFVHGFNDRCELQHNLFPTLASSPFHIQTHGFDQRGWGKSALANKQRGNSGPTPKVLQDIHEFVQYVAKSIPDITETPLFLMGHSMGGQESLHYLLNKDERYLNERPPLAGFIAASPWVGLDPASVPSRVTVFVGRILLRFIPTFQLKQELDHRYISRSEERNLEWKNDPLCHEYICLDAGDAMLVRAADLEALFNDATPTPKHLNLSLPVPTYWIHGTADKVCAYEPSKALFDKLAGPPAEVVPSGIQGKTFKTYDGAYHKLQWEPDGLDIEHARDLAGWILQVVDAQKQDKAGRAPQAKL